VLREGTRTLRDPAFLSGSGNRSDAGGLRY